VAGLRFGLKDPGPATIQALRAATQQARTHAEAIATGLGVRLGAIVSAEEASAVRVSMLDNRLATTAAAANPTPVEPGNVEVRATVVLELELVP
jgi:hypothetical protein